MASVLDIVQGGTPHKIAVLEGAAFQQQRIVLDGVQYTLGLMWNQWASYWSFSLWDSEDEPIVLGLRIVADWPLLRFYRYDTRCPQGEFFAHDLTGDRTPPGFDDFGIGKRVELTYYAQS